MSNYPFPTINDLVFVAYSGARKVFDTIYVTGQPSREAYEALAQDAHVKSVVCVRSPSETVPVKPPRPPVPPFDDDEAAELAKYGVSYRNIPIERTMSQAGFNAAATSAAGALFRSSLTGRALIHCSTGDRASSVFAVMLILVFGKTNAEVVDYAKNCLLLANDQVIGLVQGYRVPPSLAEEAAALRGAAAPWSRNDPT